jgi:hypothetical protein
MTSKKSVYKLTYPFTELNKFDQLKRADNFECALFFDSLNIEKTHYMDDLLNLFVMIESQFDIRLSNQYFVDCMGVSGNAAFLGLSMKIGRILGIELSSEGLTKAKEKLIRANEVFPHYRNNCIIDFCVGSFQDYLPLEANIYFLDNTLLTAVEGALDEGTTIMTLLDLSRNILQKAMLIILTNFVELDDTNCQLLGYSNIRCIFSRKKKRSSDYNIWILESTPTSFT